MQQSTLVSLAPFVASLAGVLPRELFPPGNVERMCAAVRDVPWQLVSLFGFECALDEAPCDADILFAANVETGGRRMRFPGTSAAWRRIDAFRERWSDPASPLHAGADDVWFEFDVAANPTTAALEPSFFFGPRVRDAGDDAAARQTRAVLHAGFDALCEHGLARGTAAALDGCLANLAPRARVFQAGLMLARPGCPVRICVDNLANTEIVEFVACVRGAVDATALAAELSRLDGTVLSVKPAFDVGDGVGPRIGLECYAVPPQRVDAGTAAWAPLLDRLVSAGACSAAKRDALLDLAPVARASATGTAWPDEGAALLGALSGHEPALGIRIHHLKLVVESGCAPRAKAYIAVAKGWSA